MCIRDRNTCISPCCSNILITLPTCYINIGTLYVHELFWMLYSVTVSAICCRNPKLRLRFVWNWVLLHTLMKMRIAVHSWFDLTNSLFFVFPSDIWCKINKLLKYYECQLTKHCLERRLEGFKVLKIMKVVEYRIAEIFIIVVDGCIIIIHEVITCDCTLIL